MLEDEETPTPLGTKPHHDDHHDTNEHQAMTKKSGRTTPRDLGGSKAEEHGSKAAAEGGKNTVKSADRGLETSRKKQRLSDLQREWLVRIGESGTEGLIVGKQCPRPTINSLLRRGLIRQTGGGADPTQRVCHLTETGTECVCTQLTERKNRREEGGGASATTYSMTISGRTEAKLEMSAGVAGAVDLKEEAVDLKERLERKREQHDTLAVGDVVKLRRSGVLNGKKGRVKEVYLKEEKACVCLIFSGHDCAPRIFEFRQLMWTDETIEECSCEDCPPLEED